MTVAPASTSSAPQCSKLVPANDTETADDYRFRSTNAVYDSSRAEPPTVARETILLLLAIATVSEFVKGYHRLGMRNFFWRTAAPPSMRSDAVSNSSHLDLKSTEIPHRALDYFRRPRRTAPNAAPQISTTRSNAEDQELRVKIRFLKVKRAEDACQARNAVGKPAHVRLSSRSSKSLASFAENGAHALQLAERLEGRILDAQEQMEMTMLDKNVAEERAEAERSAIAKVELEVLNIAWSTNAAEQKTRPAWLCLGAQTRGRAVESTGD
ncbi:hypothetical protein C8F01DRAFT_1089269 [Mycena amicta]|nr:hypothetical protein C8F01DRAFT_1089269 [Mycena amicta]